MKAPDGLGAVAKAAYRRAVRALEDQEDPERLRRNRGIRLDIAPVQRAESLPYDLDVLLRHRPPSIPLDERPL